MVTGPSRTVIRPALLPARHKTATARLIQAGLLTTPGWHIIMVLLALSHGNAPEEHKHGTCWGAEIKGFSMADLTLHTSSDSPGHSRCTTAASGNDQKTYLSDASAGGCVFSQQHGAERHEMAVSRSDSDRRPAGPGDAGQFAADITGGTSQRRPKTPGFKVAGGLGSGAVAADTGISGGCFGGGMGLFIRGRPQLK